MKLLTRESKLKTDIEQLQKEIGLDLLLEQKQLTELKHIHYQLKK